MNEEEIKIFIDEYYKLKNIQNSIKEIDKDFFFDLVDKLLYLYNKEKEEKERYKRIAEMNLKDGEEFRKNECEHRCIKYNEVLELKEELNKEIEKNEQILGNNVESFQKLFAEEISKIYISKDKIREIKEFYINDCKNRNITLIPLENLIKNINKLLED